MPAPDNLAVLELKANLNSEQREYLEVLKDRMKKVLRGKTKQELAKAGDLETLKKYKIVLTEILNFLRTKEKSLEDKFELKKQYDQQFEILKETGIIKELSDGSWGMIDILGRKQTIPSYEEIKERMEAKTEMLDKKRKQGFTKILLVPVGMSLRELADLAAQLIIKKYKQGEVLGADGKKQLIDEQHPVDVMKAYEDADIDGRLIYYPKILTKEHGGMTKKELIEKNGGWQIELIEDLPDLPRKGHGRKLGDRKQLESSKSARQYLKLIQTAKQYLGEQITIPEDSLTYFMNYLFLHNRVIDDKYINRPMGVAPIDAGAYFVGTVDVPCTCWSNISGDYDLGGTGYEFKGEDSGVRTTVII